MDENEALKQMDGEVSEYIVKTLGVDPKTLAESLAAIDRSHESFTRVHDELKKRLDAARKRFQADKAKEIDLLTEYSEVFKHKMDMEHLVSAINALNERMKGANKDSLIIKKLANSSELRHVMYYDKEIEYLSKMAVQLHNFVVSKGFTIEKWNAVVKQYAAAKEARLERLKFYGDEETGKELQKVFDKAANTDWHCLLDIDVDKKQGIPTVINRLKHERPKAAERASETMKQIIEEHLTEMKKEFESMEEIKRLEDAIKDVDSVREVSELTIKQLHGSRFAIEDLEKKAAEIDVKIGELSEKTQGMMHGLSLTIKKFKAGEILWQELNQYIPYLEQVKQMVEARVKMREQVVGFGEKAAPHVAEEARIIKFLPKLKAQIDETVKKYEALSRAA